MLFADDVLKLAKTTAKIEITELTIDFETTYADELAADPEGEGAAALRGAKQGTDLELSWAETVAEAENAVNSFKNQLDGIEFTTTVE